MRLAELKCIRLWRFKKNRAHQAQRKAGNSQTSQWPVVSAVTAATPETPMKLRYAT